MTWSFHNPTRVLFGPGALEGVGTLLPQGLILAVTTRGGAQRGWVDRLEACLEGRPYVLVDDVLATPELDAIDRQAARVTDSPVAVVAIGGGSAMDTGKALSVLLQGRRVGDAPRGHAADLPGRTVALGEALPMVAIPTVAGSGSEVTPFATLWEQGGGGKLSVHGPGLFPFATVVDPTLALTASKALTVASGLDALSQGLEALWNRNATPLTDLLAGPAVRQAMSTLLPLSENLQRLELRTQMAEAALLSGLAISRTRTALAHAVSYSLTSHFRVPHGMAAAFALPALTRLVARQDPERAETLARLCGRETPQRLADEVQTLLRALQVGEALSAHGVEPTRLMASTGVMLASGRAGNFLGSVDQTTVEELLRGSLHALGVSSSDGLGWTPPASPMQPPP